MPFGQRGCVSGMNRQDLVEIEYEIEFAYVVEERVWVGMPP